MSNKSLCHAIAIRFLGTAAMAPIDRTNRTRKVLADLLPQHGAK